VWRVSSRCPQVEHRPGQAVSHSALRGQIGHAIFLPQNLVQVDSWCSSTNSRSGTSGTWSGRPVRNVDRWAGTLRRIRPGMSMRIFEAARALQDHVAPGVRCGRGCRRMVRVSVCCVARDRGRPGELHLQVGGSAPRKVRTRGHAGPEQQQLGNVDGHHRRTQKRPPGCERHVNTCEYNLVVLGQQNCPLFLGLRG